MKYLTITVVFLGITGTLIALRGLAWHPAGAQYVKTNNEPDAAALPVVDRSGNEGAALDVVFARGDDSKNASNDKLIARLAADCAAHLHDKAKKQPDNVRLLEQAAAHYRACLSHETTVDDAAPLFADARKNLQQIEKLLASAKIRKSQKPSFEPAPKTAEKTTETPKVVAKKDEKPVPQPLPAPVVEPKKKEKEEPLTFGPDGVIFRKQRSDD